jgi:hypothetical protein
MRYSYVNIKIKLELSVDSPPLGHSVVEYRELLHVLEISDADQRELTSALPG